MFKKMFSNINNNSNLDLNYLMFLFVNAIYEETNFIGIEVDNTKYYQLPNKWAKYGTIDPEYNTINQIYICYSADHCTLKRRSTPNKYKFIIDYGENSEGIDEKMFTYNTLLNIKCISNLKEEHYFSDHYIYDLPLKDKVVLYNPMLKDVIDALYIIRMHKTHKKFELLKDVRVTNITCLDDLDNPLDEAFKYNTIDIEISFIYSCDV